MPTRKKKPTRTAKRPVRKKVVTPKIADTVTLSADAIRIKELEVENRQLKAQLADQRNSATMVSAPLQAPARTYKGLAITFGLVALALMVVVLFMLER